MVDLDSDPTKLIDVVEIGKQLLITRGALTTFSIANDIAKYFAIIPAMFVATYPRTGALNVMRPALAAVGHPVGGDLQRADHRRPDPAGPAGSPLPTASATRCCAGTWSSTASAASSSPFVGIKIIDLLVSHHPRNLGLTTMLTRLLRPLASPSPALRAPARADRACSASATRWPSWARRPGLRRPRRRISWSASTAGRRLPPDRPALRRRRSGSSPGPSANDYDTPGPAAAATWDRRTRTCSPPIEERRADGRAAEGVDPSRRCRPTP